MIVAKGVNCVSGTREQEELAMMRAGEMGLSGNGHGYKFCSVTGEVIADLVTGDGTIRHDISVLRLHRPARASPLASAAD